LSDNRIIAVDVGGGTQDILIYEEGNTIENSVKMILPSQTRIVANRIVRFTKQRKAIFLEGNLMGGGASGRAVKNHISAGLNVYATELAAKTFHDNPAKIEKMGIEIVSEPPEEAVSVVLADIDLDAVKNALGCFEEKLPDVFAVAVQDHGECIDGSNRWFRFQHWQSFLQDDGEISHLAYRNPPPYLTRMRAVKRDIPKAIVMDTCAAAILGALSDPLIAKESRRGVIIINIGNQHTVGALVRAKKILGLFEHHTSSLTPRKLDYYINCLLKGTLTNEEVFKDGGHGCFIRKDFSQGNEFKFISVTGPRRQMAKELGYYFAVPYGDMMLTGCFGLINAAIDSPHDQ